MIKYLRAVLFFAVLMYSYCAGAQTATSLDKTLQSLQKQATEYPFEKTYLHLDRPYYTVGDTIWLKGYTVMGASHTLTKISSILYTELINSNNQIIQTLKLPVGNGLSHGAIILPSTLKAGNYRVRAYTNWMRNAGSEYFFDKKIKVSAVSGTQNNVAPPAAITDVDVQFFPESGNLINGVNSKIAFKAVASNGLGADVKGVILDEQNKEVATFTSSHLGMGTFMLTPAAGKSYKARVTYLNNQSKTINLPAALSSGYALAIDNSNADNVIVKTIAAGGASMGNVTLIAQSGGQIFFAGKGSAEKNELTSAIPKSRFPSGIIQFVLLNNDGLAVNERLVFIQNADQLDLSVSSAKTTYAPREKVTVNLNAKTADGQASTGNFSVAVINETEMPSKETEESTIFSNLLLTSDIKGFVEQPNYYFTNVSDKTRADLDALMLTQGYHRFEWKKLINGEMPVLTYAPEDELTITGRILTNSNKPIARAKVSLMSMDGGSILDTVTNEQGRFVFDRLTFLDSTKMLLKALNARGGENVKIQLDQDIVPPVVSNTPEAVDNNSNAAYAARAKKIYDDKMNYGIITDRTHILLDEVKVVGNSVEEEKKRAIQYSSNLNGPGNADQVIYADNQMIGCPDFITCMLGRLTGVQRQTDTDGKTFLVMQKTPNMTTTSIKQIAMGVVYNGIFVNPDEVGDFFQEVDMSTIATVEVLRMGALTAAYGSRGGNGVIIITTKHGPDLNLDYVKNSSSSILKFSPKGYYRARDFYSPKFSIADAQKPDFRTIVYWNPSVQINGAGSGSFDYFNTDSKGTYKVTIEGIDQQTGKIGRQVYRYTVQ